MVFAFGELGLKPWEFDALTPREFRLMQEGRERDWYRLAQMVVWMVQPNFSAQLVPNDILHGRPRPPKRD